MSQPTWRSVNAPTVLLKFPEDDRIYQFDFSGFPELGAGLTPVSAELIVAPFPDSLSVVVETLDPSGIVQIRVAAGAAAVTYSIECDLVLSDGSVLVMFGLLAVVDPNTFSIAPPPAVVPGLAAGGVHSPMSADLDAANHTIANLRSWSSAGLFFQGGAGVPVDGSQPDGSFFFRSDPSGPLTSIYQAQGGVWVGIV